MEHFLLSLIVEAVPQQRCSKISTLAGSRRSAFWRSFRSDLSCRRNDPGSRFENSCTEPRSPEIPKSTEQGLQPKVVKGDRNIAIIAF